MEVKKFRYYKEDINEKSNCSIVVCHDIFVGKVFLFLRRAEYKMRRVSIRFPSLRNRLAGRQWKSLPPIWLLSADAGQISEEYQNDVALCVANGLVNGYDDNTLRPKDEIVRVEALVLLSRALKADLMEAEPDIAYTDVPDWASNDISRLTKAGMVRGVGDNLLGAEENLTVEQVKLLTDRVDAALIPAAPQQNFYGNRNAKILRNAVIEEGNTFWRVLEHEGKEIAEELSNRSRTSC